ncbi:hypothetical protein T459_01791 [Capsicum annuum]|uniref:HD-Zip IV C-terminal domain-containing protein n=1 Tax=Capsicum annuum TaxID=4072 RepID=A0A2G3AI41_CAPAN|nr:hypothetical protein T459_01791 [Capsicum annuum]
MDTTSPMAPCFENGLSIPLPVISPWLTTILNEKVTYDMPKMMDLASTAMNELLRTEATRASGTVISNSLALVETLTDKIKTEFQIFSDLVPVREVKFLRFCSNMVKEASVGLYYSRLAAGYSKISIWKLAQRMNCNFCAGICATIYKWKTIQLPNEEDAKLMTRKNIDDPSEPIGVVLSASKTIWLPMKPQCLLEFFMNEQMRSQWVVLSSNGPMQQMVHISKDKNLANSVSLFRANVLMSSSPVAKLSTEAIKTVNDLMSRTIHGIKSALKCK